MEDSQQLALVTDSNEDVDQDLLLARILQEQERAFHALVASSLRTHGSSVPNSSNYGVASSVDGSEGELDDEELARRLQSEEDQQAYQQQYQQPQDAGAFLAFQFEDEGQELDFDQLGYEDLNLIGDVAGKVSKGLQPEAISSLPVVQLQQIKQRPQQQCCNAQQDVQQKAQKAFEASSMCAICQMEYEAEDFAKLLPCCHMYHKDCVDQWLSLNKTCPICNKEVTGDGSNSSSVSTSRVCNKPIAAPSPLKHASAAETAADTQACP